MTEESLFVAALAHEDPAERAEFLRKACIDDVALLRRLEALVRVHEQPGELPLIPPDSTDDDIIDMTNMTFDADGKAIDGTLTAAIEPDTDDSSTSTLIDGRPDEAFGAAVEKPGDVIGPYTLVCKLGEGGMGVVFEAQQDKPVRRKVALKVIKAGMDTRQVVSRFNAERQALAVMDHPSIAHVLDAGATDAGRPFFVMELVEGRPITEYCDSNRLSTRQRIELLMSVCQAVQHAHQKGIIHRDLKPSNVLVALNDGKPAPKIIDFGIAKAIDQDRAEATIFTQQGAIVGTPEYMSPEQAGGAPDVDTRTDVYALGVILYELLTGSTPLGRETLRHAGYLEILRKVREDEPPKPSTRLSTSGDRLAEISAVRNCEPSRLSRQVRGELDWIAMKALEKDRSRRYGTPAELKADLRRYLEGDVVLAGRPSQWYRLEKFARKHRAGLAAAALILMILMGATAVSVWQAAVARKARRDAELAKSRSDEDRAEAESVNKFLVEAFRSPDPSQDGRKLLVVDLLDKAVNQLRTEKDVSPRTRATLLATLGETYLGLGMTERSAVVNEDAHRQALAALGPDNPLTFHIETNQTLASGDVIGLSKATAGLVATLTRCEARLGPDHDETLRICHYLGKQYRDGGNFQAAIAMHAKVAQAREAKLGPDHLDTLLSRVALAEDYGVTGQTSSAIPLFEATGKAFEAKFGADHPETLRCRNGLAEAFRHAGRFAEAIALHEATLKAREAKLGPHHYDTLWSRDCLADDYLAAGDFEKAIAMHEASVHAIEARLPDDNPRVIFSRQGLAMAYLAAGRAEAAIPLLESIFKARAVKFGLFDPASKRTLGDLGNAYRAVGRHDDLIRFYQLQIRASEVKLGVDDPATLLFRGDLAAAYANAGRVAEAIPLMEALLKPYDAKLGPVHPSTIVLYTNLITNYAIVGRIDQSISLSRSILKRCEDQLGPLHASTAGLLASLTLAYANHGRRDEAIALVEDSFKRFEARMGPNDLQGLPLRALIATCLQNIGCNDRAERVWTDTLVLVRKNFGEDHAETLSSRVMLANLDMIRRGEGAEPAFLDLIATARAKLGGDNPNTLVFEQFFINTVQGQGRPRSAEPLLRDHLDRARKALPPGHPVVGNCLAELVLNLLQQRKWSEAEPLARECLKIREAINPADWPAANSRSMVGGALLGQGRFAEAEPSIVTGYEQLKLKENQLPDPAKVRVTEAGDRVIRLYEEWGKPEKAAEWSTRIHPLTLPDRLFAD